LRSIGYLREDDIMPKFRKKPVEIEAVQWKGHNLEEVLKLVVDKTFTPTINGGVLEISTLEGVMVADINDWIIRGVKDELYPCKPDIFEQTYDKV